MHPVEDTATSLERYSYQADHGTRLAGLAGTVGVYALMLAGYFLTIGYVTPVEAPPPALSVFDVNPPTSPPETPPEDKEAPEPVKEKKVQPNEHSEVQISPVTVPIPVIAPKHADSGPKEPETAAPKTALAPPAPEASSNAPDTWEGRVLSALNKVRRYPRMAMARRQQGIPYVRIVIDREGKVLSSRLERSSGFSDLDREAVALPKRASPLPKPPADKPGDTLELVVPVEFFLR
ncbi:TonB family protein [Sphingobium cloacae]|uniref:TonB family protein n=2 Tax=Sphingobium cloacae TaxID=120107 RepID=A0A1E1F492_9SPHN|nr:TonB family protein [Sphingobium cloacae]